MAVGIIVLSKAIRRIERHRETVMMASLGPEWYSGSSDTAPSWVGVGSMTFSDRSRSLLPAACIEDELSVDSFSPGRPRFEVEEADGGSVVEIGGFVGAGGGFTALNGNLIVSAFR